MKLYFKLLCAFLCVLSCDDIIEVEDISDKEVIVLAPSNQVILNTTDVIFTWEALEDAETYHLQIATPTSVSIFGLKDIAKSCLTTFENAQQIVHDSMLVGTRFSTTLDFKGYEWRVRAENSGYTTSYKVNSFSIEE